jgi:hypothetical protein
MEIILIIATIAILLVCMDAVVFFVQVMLGIFAVLGSAFVVLFVLYQLASAFGD